MSDFTQTVLLALRVVAPRADVALESRSGAAVHRVRTADGRPAYLKVTPAQSDPETISAARREQRFYQHLAPSVPVPTPELLGQVDTDDGVAILLAAAGQARDAASWTPQLWARLGRDLAKLHRMPLPAGADWTRPDGLRDALAAPDMAELTAFWAPSLPRLRELVSRRGELRAEMNALPPVFVHGDCHTHNIIVDAEGSLVFCDWQAAGVGRPSSDLAFPGVRAAPDGLSVPAVMLDAYLENMPCERHVLERALLAEELAIFVFLWPPYAGYNSPAAISRVRRRTRQLAARWFATADGDSGAVCRSYFP